MLKIMLMEGSMVLIKTELAIDVVPVVRCRECKYHNKPPCPTENGKEGDN